MPQIESIGRMARAGLLMLELGQEVDAQVMERVADGRVILEIGGTLVEANDPGSLDVGQRLRLRVDLLEPQLLLHIIEQELSPEAEATKLLRQRLPMGEQDSLTGLKSIIESGVPINSGASEQVGLEKLRDFLANLVNNKEIMSAERLMQFVRDGGLHYEKKLLQAAAEKYADLTQISDNDLKGLLLAALEEADGDSISAESRRAIAGQLYHLEKLQAANLLAQLDHHAFQLQIPLFTGAGFTDVALAVEADADGKKNDSGKRSGGYNILFSLDLEELGCLRIDAHLKGRDLRVMFYADADSFLELLGTELPPLRESLRAVGFHEVLLAVRRLREMAPVSEEKFTSLARVVPAHLQLLNVKV